jgi:UDP-glucose 4-epimerase
MSKIAVTGCSGRIANAVIPFLEVKYPDVIRVSRVKSNCSVSYEDAFCNDLFSEVSVILHSAWSMVPITSEKFVSAEWQNDIPLLSKLLAEAAKSPQKPLFIFLSSAGAVYGNSDGIPHNEEDSLNPIGWYGRAKVAAEMLCNYFKDAFAMNILILRITNPYGFEYKADRPQGIIQTALHCGINNETLKIWGNGSSIKDYLYIDDLCHAIAKLIDKKCVGTYNVSYGASYSVVEVLSVIQNILGYSINIEYYNAPKWDVSASRISNDLLCKAIDWGPKTPLSSGITKCIQDSKY